MPTDAMSPCRVAKRSVEDEAGNFDVTVVAAGEPTRVVLFAVGGGGNPQRHLPLLLALGVHGCTVVAPHFERLRAPAPTRIDLLLRARRLGLALDSMQLPGLPVAGVGHSIGSTMLLALVGGRVWMDTGEMLSISRDLRLDKLVLFAPAAKFFYAPKALDSVCAPILAWVGTNDLITPPEQTEFVKNALEANVPMELRLVEGADHFSFMHERPPQSVDPLSHRNEFLADLTAEVCRFVTR